MAKDKKLTNERSLNDFKRASAAKSKLLVRQKEDFLFALGKQWSDEDVAKLKEANIKPITDNRIQPNIFLLTGLERQNRTDFKAFPEGEEDSIKAEIASALFKHSIKISDFSYKSSEQFKDGVVCGESHLELYLDNTENIINGKPKWKKIDGNCIFPEPGFKEYDFSDAKYVYKVTFDVSEDDLINLYPEKQRKIEVAGSGKIDLVPLLGGEEKHRQPKDYPKDGQSGIEKEDEGFDLLERYYKKYVDKVFVGDKQTGDIKEAESAERAEQFIFDYQAQISEEENQYAYARQQALRNHMAKMIAPQMAALPMEQHLAMMEQSGEMPTAPPQKDPNRFILIKRRVPEMWCYAHVPGIDGPLSDERAWFYPKWKAYPFIPYFARFSTAPLTGDDRHLLVQGIVHGVKGVQEKHNKSEMLTIRHLNSATNSGWIAEEDSWVDRNKVAQFGATPGINLEYKKGSQKPERIFPMPLSQGHAALAAESAEAIKAQLGINADLLAVQEGGTSSGRAIALRQRQGLLMVQELFDNLSRSRAMAGKFLLTQLGEIFDTETAKKVLGKAFLVKNFPAPMLLNEQTGQQEPMKDKYGQPMEYDSEMADLAIAEVLSGELGQYDVAVGEAVASETMRIANSEELKEFAQAYPGLIPPEMLIEESQIPQSTKNKVLSSIKQAQMAQQQAQAMAMGGAPAMAGAV